MRNHLQTTRVAVQPAHRAHAMRPYPVDSPNACARIVSLTLVCDGQVKRSELALFDQLRGLEQLGLTRAEFQMVLSSLCADLLATARARGDGHCSIGPMLIGQWMGEVRDAGLRRMVLRLCSAMIHADGYVHEAESTLMLAAIEHWGMRPEKLEALDPLTSEVDVVLSRWSRDRAPGRADRTVR